MVRIYFEGLFFTIFKIFFRRKKTICDIFYEEQISIYK